MNNIYENNLEKIYEEEISKLISSVEGYISENKSQGIAQMIGRRYGCMWERLVKYSFELSETVDLKEKVLHKDYVSSWIKDKVEKYQNDCCKDNSEHLLKEFLEENTGTPTQDLCDFTFFIKKEKYAVDTKLRFNSNDSNTVREIANSAHHLKYMGYNPILLFRREKSESQQSPIKRFVREGWDLKCGDEAMDFVEKITGNDLGLWIDKNIDIWNRLSRYQSELIKLRFGKEKWEF